MNELEAYDESSSIAPSERSRRLIAPLIVGGVIAAVLLAMRTPIVAWIRGFLSSMPSLSQRRAIALLDQGLSPESIRDAIVGRGKSAVASHFGRPRTAAADSFRQIRSRDFWNADTWYYPIDTRTQTAMAVRFERGIARTIEFFEMPRTS